MTIPSLPDVDKMSKSLPAFWQNWPASWIRSVFTPAAAAKPQPALVFDIM
jgi:hypothetical protein